MAKAPEEIDHESLEPSRRPDGCTRAKVSCALTIFITVAVAPFCVSLIRSSGGLEDAVSGFVHVKGAKLITTAAKGSTTAFTTLSPGALAQNGFVPDARIILDLGGPTEEIVTVLSNDPLTFAEPLSKDHPVGAALVALKGALPPSAEIVSATQQCSNSSGQTPPLGVATGRAAEIFEDLSPEEVRAVVRVFTANTGAASSMLLAKPGQDYITGISGVELLLPSKAEALAALDRGDPAPKRFARVYCARPLKEDVMEYRVGPITGSHDQPSVAAEITSLLKDGEVPFTKRPPELLDPLLDELMKTTLLKLSGLLEEAFGKAFPTFSSYDPSAGTIVGFPVFPDVLKSTINNRVSLAKFMWSPDANKEMSYGRVRNSGNDPNDIGVYWLHPIPFVFSLVQPGSDADRWYTNGFYFCGQGPFDSAEALLAANTSRRLLPCKYKLADVHNNSKPGDWDYPGPVPGAKNPRSNRRAPRQASPDGPRWAVSSTRGGSGRQVEWMDWTFFVSMRPRTGIAFWDIRFKGRRVAYEVSLQESAAVYAGAQGDQTYYLDSAMTGLGHTTVELHPGLDCPADASLFSNTFWGRDPSNATSVRSACIFEEDVGQPLWTHLNEGLSTVGTRASVLVVRSMANSGNYDYFASLRFGLDGSMQWTSTLAGFCEARWFSPEANAWEQELSPIWHDDLALPLHSHLLNVKVDLDIGEHDANSFERMESVVGFPPKSKAAGVLSDQPTKYIRRSYLQNETGFDKSSMTPVVMRVVNRAQHGPSSNSPPGYAIVPGENVKNTLPDNHPLVKAITYSKYSLAVTRYHDDEQAPTSVYDSYAVQTPHVTLDNYLANQENVDGADVVLWVSLGHEHLPRTEDVPLISNYDAGFKLLPWNMFNGHQAMDIPQDPADKCMAVVE